MIAFPAGARVWIAGGVTDNRIIAKVRARGEHPFRIIRRQSGHVKTRCRGLARNRARLFTPFAPGHLFLVRRWLLA